MTQIKAAFFDIDGTLLPFQAKALPESTVQALAALRKNGVKTFIAAVHQVHPGGIAANAAAVH